MNITNLSEVSERLHELEETHHVHHAHGTSRFPTEILNIAEQLLKYCADLQEEVGQLSAKTKV